MAVERRKDNKNRVLKEGEYQRANGSFEYKWRDKKGKRHSVYAKTLDELREMQIDVLRDVLDGIRADKNDITINDLYYRWMQLKRGLKHNTFQNYKYMYTQFVELDFGEMKVADLKRSDVRAFYNHLSDSQHLKTATIDNIHTVLHQVLELGVEDDYLRYNPSDNALKELKKAHNNDSDKRRALTVPEQDLFENFLSDQGQYHRWYPIFTVLLWTGMRVGEITGLRWCDIDLEDETISVNHTLVYYDKGGEERCGFSINTPKTKAGERSIPILPKVKEAFLMEKEYQKECGLDCNAVVDGYTDFIFINRFGGVQHQGTLNKALRRIIRDCNYEVLDKGEKEAITLPRFSNHSLRHTFTTRMCEAGVNIKAMQDILGHADAETTMDIYAEATKDLKKAELINFEAYFNTQKKAQIGTE
ncbi:tyrosine-type recombinase/integrase [Candidatus Galacturonibacter soehngenii]|uniref:Site-specific integrase n=1 Tax=Candidatus Galacturonatibacter soehngenii TaxID=2307010 RepID=A0A7V7QHC0_9FIRM|nr:tyrosine-type recombinase/integrase [Candidatus Galacturonibacter soehngenii]KAB1434315.1 site-specific integrase [Candidatus Galacturonibacter soehngenii]